MCLNRPILLAYLKLHPSCMQLFDLFDVQQKGFIDFGDFVRSLNVFHPNAPQEVKIECKCLGCDIM